MKSDRRFIQVEEEISKLFDFMEFTYGLFGFEFSLELSTRPENYLGQIETWNEAEAVSTFMFPISRSPTPSCCSVLGLSLSFSHSTDSLSTTATTPKYGTYCARSIL